jgi:hypothetical protein
MLHAGLDLSRRKVDVCLLSPAGEIVEGWAARRMPTACAALCAAPARTV